MDRPELQSLYSLTQLVIDNLVEEMLLDGMNSADDDFYLWYSDALRRSVRVLSMGQKTDRISSEIHAALEDLSTAYSVQQRRENPLSNLFVSPVYRCAYVYRHFVSHAYLLRQFLLEAYCTCIYFRGQMDSFLEREDFRLCAIGGGPGTDIVGLMMFLNAEYDSRLCPNYQRVPGTGVIPCNFYMGDESCLYRGVHLVPTAAGNLPVIFCPTVRGNVGRCGVLGKAVRLHVDVLDNCCDWKHTADELCRTYKSSIGRPSCDVHHVTYHHANFTDPEFVAQNWPHVQNADLVTIVKVVSAVAGCGERRKRALLSLESIFTKMKPGALVFYLDNAGGGYTELVDTAAAKCGLRVWYRTEHKECRIPRPDDTAGLESHRSRFQQVPQGHACVTVIIWWKPHLISK